VRIGELADAAGVSTKTIRFYESAGVLAEPPRTPAGYREYTPDTLAVLRFVRAAQAVGLTLGEIREIVAYRDHEVTPCAHVVELLRRRASEIDDRISQLEAMRTELRRLERRARRLQPEDCSPSLVCHVIPRT
jgi:DNA-binding transcriptional MerR regulator